MGHRISLDLDFFARDHFNEDALVQRVQVLPGFALAAKAPFTIHATIEGIKVSFLGYAYPILFPTDTFLDVSVADPRDIACMKVSAISSRGAKRDFVDLYVCAKQFGLDEILRLFGNKYAQTRWSRTHILKSLTYFADAEKDPMPRMLAPVDWSEVKAVLPPRGSATDALIRLQIAHSQIGPVPQCGKRQAGNSGAGHRSKPGLFAAPIGSHL